ncbi:helix-turn-helix transcriptional regulator [Portibacter marinus]|uniref:helix-turn-helix transcriptional regulator n=1 Tax=Portibacter marinus TaxID=2898660 RepID=UPI001F17DAA7|nr:AraC family transcriptional regulator [Portibacter marinus]
MKMIDKEMPHTTVQVTSQPLREVIENIAEAWDAEVKEICSEFIVEVPRELGEGTIQGISFDNGLGIIIYQCSFNQEISFEFTLNNIHPIKYLYSVEGPIVHKFENEDEKHVINRKKCALVASSQQNGHILTFKKNNYVNLISLEINREEFVPGLECELNEISQELYDVLTDTEAVSTFYHDGYYGIDFEYLLDNVLKYRGSLMLRKMHLLSLALDIFVKQVKLFEDDMKAEGNQQILRANEIYSMDTVTDYIRSNLDSKLSIEKLSKVAGLNANKLQMGFKFIHNLTVMEFVRRERLRMASNLLISTEQSINTISRKCGFESPSYFTKAFTKIYGIAPTSYRNNSN